MRLQPTLPDPLTEALVAVFWGGSTSVSCAVLSEHCLLGIQYKVPCDDDWPGTVHSLPSLKLCCGWVDRGETHISAVDC